MQTLRTPLIVLTLSAAALLSACGPRDATQKVDVAPSTTTQATVPPPPGDSTPQAADSHTRNAVEANEKPSTTGSQSTVGTAASGAPPYTLNGAPEANPSPSQGSKSGEPAKK